jgi:hypothetical protein
MMSSRLHILMVSATLVWLVIPVHEVRADGPTTAPAEFKLARASSVFHWRRSGKDYEVIVGTVDGFRVSSTLDGAPRSSYLIALYADPYLMRLEEIAKLVSIWPLVVGKTVTYVRQEQSVGGRHWQDEVSVVGTETVRIGEKNIDAYIVRWKSSGTGGNSWYGEQTAWFAPSLGWNIRVKYSDSTPNSEYEVQLIDYKLAP